ncbi:hypothetical protein GCM10010277_80370 [Streptomyces longisporoflavus]|uniref:hypothetical protein n=1 Tax=Streptomyces longisporoflavus TaxID=28044 RepID=UPI00167C6D6B|nr:hypothetical protein [Streptomyces longisporoflavus]GGV69887.1 hypothetical protein GCM10010277_80370 [Streptomyces longisporoflavus]
MRESDGPQRQIYVCLGCAAQYLPPGPMTYPLLGVAASPVHCSRPECASTVAESMNVIALPPEQVAKWARRAAGVEGPVRRGRPGRTARGRRAQPSPATGRTRLR